METSARWHEDEAFWQTFGARLFSAQLWEGTPAEIDAAVELLKLPTSAAVLDLPCGQGRHSLELARRDMRVTAVDRTAAYLLEGQRRAQADGLKIEWLEQDMRAFSRPGAFDAVFNLYTSFGYFEDPEDDRRVARNFYESLKPGGVLLMDIMGKEILARMFREHDWQKLEDGTLFLEERKVTRHWTWIESRWIAIRDGHRREFRVEHRLYSAGELVEVLRNVGFHLVEAYGDLRKAPYNHEAKRLVIVAQKSDE